MTAQQLKNSILQMAVQGKLVPQDSNDEPASVLLERIKAEKQELIKAGKIKKDKKSSEIFRGASRNLPYAFCEQIGKDIRDVSDEIPFEIPDSWEWVRLGDLFHLIMGQSPKGDKVFEGGNGTEFHQGKICFGDKYLNPSNQATSEPTKIAPANSTLLCVRAPVGKVNITDREICIGRGLCAVIPLGNMTVDFTFFWLATLEDSFIKQATGTTFIAITGEVVKNQLIPIPPLSEQHRIVAKIEELLPYIERYGKAEEHLTALNTTFPEALKKSILQEAVQGKLVLQNPDDEPASVLLERIRAEKQELIKAGKIKRDKHESVIVTRDKIPYEIIDREERCIADEVPFEIPDSWCWCRLSSFTTKITDGTHHSPPNIEKGEYKYITAKNIKDAGVNLANITYVSKEIHEEIFSRCNPEYGDVLLIKDGATTGVVTVNNIEEPFSLLSSVALIKCSKEVNPWYLVYVLRSDLFYKNMRSQMKGTGITRITLKQIEPLLIPVPPLAEQHRIVAKIEEIMPMIERLTLR